MSRSVLLPSLYGIAGFMSVVDDRPLLEELERVERTDDFKRKQARARRTARQRAPVDRTVGAQLRGSLAERDREIVALRGALLERDREGLRLQARILVLEMKERALARAEAFELTLDAALNRGELTDRCKTELSARLAEGAAATRRAG